MSASAGSAGERVAWIAGTGDVGHPPPLCAAATVRLRRWDWLVGSGGRAGFFYFEAQARPRPPLTYTDTLV
ncbi:hypothetical protein GUJ93_ZPchr0007g3676 [Zizania palustris]|uniref:Uncharacterized protein n=1 Tax=Zizania palustris TaxID=103762 RepID=A0A8J5W4C3_ZIZPA|nr:hypothetical protein GUJ93_ZPchr0007g3676 [Zizania palustris]